MRRIGKIIEHRRVYRDNHRDEINQKARENYERYKTKKKEYETKNRDEICRKKTEYYEKNKDEINRKRKEKRLYEKQMKEN